MRKNIASVAFLVLLFSCYDASGQETIPLYLGKVPNSINVKNEEVEGENQWFVNVSIPTLTIFQAPENIANGTSIILCPGGGYSSLNMNGEGYALAKKLNAMGITAFVLKYRLPNDKYMVDKTIGPLQDAQQAIKLVREHAKKYNIDPNKIGIMGSSAGGHLASSAGTHFNKAYIENNNNTSLRPDFMILVYPVISFTDSIGHIGSRDMLIGKNPDLKILTLFSNELQVTTKTPPAFLIHASDDGLVPVKNSTVFYLAMLKNNVQCGLHIFPVGQHGFPLAPANTVWFNYCAMWLKENKWM